MSNDSLRTMAESRVALSASNSTYSDADQQHDLVYELQVHREELLIQNEELRRIQFDLQSAKYRYSDLYDFAPVGYITVEHEGTIVSANLMASRMLNRERSTLIGAKLASFCPVDSRQLLAGHLENFDQKNHPTWCELQLELGPEGLTHVRLDCNRVEDPSGDSSNDSRQIRVVMTDVSERCSAQEAVVARDRTLRTIADALPVLIAYFNTDLQFQFANAAYQDWFGTAPESLINQPASVVHADIVSFKLNESRGSLLDGQRLEFAAEIEHRTLGARKLEVKLIPDTSPKGSVAGIHVLGIDVTERRKLQTQSSRHNEIADRLQRLSTKERPVYDRLIRGASNGAIAKELSIGLRTVERHRQSILKKLEVQTLAEMLHKFAEVTGLY